LQIDMTIGHVIENAMITKATTIYTTKSTFNKIFTIDLMLRNQNINHSITRPRHSQIKPKT